MAQAPKLPQTTHLKKPVVFAVAGILVFLLLFAIVNAFKTATPKNTTPPLTASQTSEKTLAPIFKELPSDYNDTAIIKKYVTNDAEKNLTLVEQELNNLKNQYNSLQQQFVNSLQHQSQASTNAANPQNDQARTSNLFFAGSNETSLIKGGDSPAYNPNPTSPSSTQTPDQALGTPVTQQQAEIFSRQRTETQKLAVMKAADNPEDIYDLHNMVKPISPYEIQAGTIIPAVLITGINTTLSGVVVAQVKQNIYDTVTGKYLLIPKGAKALGEYDTRVAYGDQRVLITFNRIIRPDGSSILLGKPMAADYQGQSGVEGNIDNHWWRILGAATLSTILSVGTGAAADRSGNYNTLYQSSRQGAILGAAGAINQTGQGIVNRGLDIRPTLTLPPGYQFNIIVRKDMVLTPYQAENF